MTTDTAPEPLVFVRRTGINFGNNPRYVAYCRVCMHRSAPVATDKAEALALGERHWPDHVEVCNPSPHPTPPHLGK